MGASGEGVGGARLRGGAALRTSSVLAAGLLILCAAWCAFMVLRQESFVYFPDPALRGSPRSVGLPYEDALLATPDGLELGAWWIPTEEPRGAVILCQGNAGNRSDRLDKALYLHRAGLDVLMFDYRGYGGNAGKPSEEGTYRDAAAAVDYVVAGRHVPPTRLILWGESLGGAVAVETAERRPPAGLVLESTFTSVRAMARRYYPWLPTGLMWRLRYDSLSKVGAIPCAKLVLHGPDDEIVPFSMGEELFRAARAPKSFEKLVGGHNAGGIVVSPAAQAAVAVFLDSLLGGRAVRR